MDKKTRKDIERYIDSARYWIRLSQAHSQPYKCLEWAWDALTLAEEVLNETVIQDS
jgi:hypothetical protein